MNKSTLSYFNGSILFTILSILICYMIAGPMGAFYGVILAVLETSLSVDNAVVNATVLKDMDEKWRKRFLTWGILIAVFGMRVLFPILIVWATSPLSLYQSVLLPFEDASEYARVVSAAHIDIAGYGGAFLMMVFFAFFLDHEKEVHWIPGLEKLMHGIGSSFTEEFQKLKVISLFTLVLAFLVSMAIPDEKGSEFMIAVVLGIITYAAVKWFGNLFEAPDEATGAVARTGLAGFLYLEVLDASFSFDGVIGAFAITNNIIIIALGLGIGAMFVRSMTIYMVDKGTLENFKYLENGAFWSIGILAACMFTSVMVHVPEVFTGLMAGVILCVAVVHSLLEKKGN